MPRCGYIEGKIFEVEGFDVTIRYNDNDVRSDKQLPVTYGYSKRAPEDWTVSEWIENRFKTTFPGYTVDVLLANGTTVPGNTRLKNVRASYPDSNN